MPAIPHLSMAGVGDPEGLRRLAAEMAAAYTGVGIAYVTGHGIRAASIAALFDASRRFHALPQADKDAIAVNRHHRGYIAPGAATDRASSIEAATRPNLSESFLKLSEAPPGRPAVWPLDGPNQWPDLAGFREAVTAFEAAAGRGRPSGQYRRYRAGLERRTLAVDAAPGRQPAGPGPLFHRLVLRPRARRPDRAARRFAPGRFIVAGAVPIWRPCHGPARRHLQLPADAVLADISQYRRVANAGSMREPPPPSTSSGQAFDTPRI